MLEEADVIVVGSGFCGSIIARRIAEEFNRKVVVIDKRNHIAGNMYDEKNEYGIMVQKYGPHKLHTNSKQVFDYVNKYGQWEDYKLKCRVYMDGKFTPSPFNFQTIDDYFSKERAREIKYELKRYYKEIDKVTIVEMLECDNLVIRNYAKFLLEKDYRPYTVKQWGISPEDMDVSVLKRVPVRISYKEGYFDDKYQIMPKYGFTHFFGNLLNHNNIMVQLNKNALETIYINEREKSIYLNGKKTDKIIVFTGALDELLNYKYGVLPYRSLEFKWEVHKINSFQDAPVVAYPQEDRFTRITEYTKIPVQESYGTTIIAKEYPIHFNKDDKKKMEPYYPIVSDENREQYNKYLNDIKDITNLYICGRLADYKYYNMDQSILRAFEIYEQIQKKFII